MCCRVISPFSYKIMSIMNLMNGLVASDISIIEYCFRYPKSVCLAFLCSANQCVTAIMKLVYSRLIVDRYGWHVWYSGDEAAASIYLYHLRVSGQFTNRHVVHNVHMSWAGVCCSLIFNTRRRRPCSICCTVNLCHSTNHHIAYNVPFLQSSMSQ